MPQSESTEGLFDYIRRVEETPENVVDKLGLTVRELRAFRQQFDLDDEEKSALESLIRAAMAREIFMLKAGALELEAELQGLEATPSDQLKGMDAGFREKPSNQKLEGE